MSTVNEDQGFPHVPHHKKHEETEQDTPGTDEFVEIRESAVPWDPDRPIVREDEQYGRLSETDLFPSERVIDPRVLPPNH